MGSATRISTAACSLAAIGPADQYLLLADFVSYCDAGRRMMETYGDRTRWNQISLHNIARSGVFAADRSIRDYARDIWHVPCRE